MLIKPMHEKQSVVKCACVDFHTWAAEAGQQAAVGGWALSGYGGE